MIYIGLDISAYEIVEPLPAHEYDGDECYDAGHLHAWSEFPGSLAGWPWVEDHITQAFVVGCMQTSGERMDFRAGSYGGYNTFREALSMAALQAMPRLVWAEPGEFAGRPFYELINFSDAEGVISSEVATKLARDFVEGRRTVRHALDGWMVGSYDEWEAAFALAAGRGAVDFH